MRKAIPAGLAFCGTVSVILLVTNIVLYTKVVGHTGGRYGSLPPATEPVVTQKTPAYGGFSPNKGPLAPTMPVSAPEWAERMFKDGRAKDFGVVPVGTQLMHSFEITNIYAAPMEITGLRPGCGCVTATAGKHTLLPGESTTIDVVLDTRKFIGPRTESVRVAVGPIPESICVLKVSAVCQTDVVFNPEQIAFAVAIGEASTKSIDVEYNGTRDWKIEEVIVPKGLPVEATLSQLARGPGKVGYRLDVTLKNDAPAGNLKDYLYLKTNQKDVPPVPVPVAATVQAPLMVMPGIVTLGIVKAGAPQTRHVLVRATKPFRVVAVEGLGDGITLDVQLPQAAAANNQTLAFRCVFSDSGEFTKEPRIKTDLPEAPVTVTIQGTVTPAK